MPIYIYMILFIYIQYNCVGIFEIVKIPDSKWCHIVMYGNHIELNTMKLYYIIPLLYFVK